MKWDWRPKGKMVWPWWARDYTTLASWQRIVLDNLGRFGAAFLAILTLHSWGVI
ncbi:MAG: hypothetical protein V3W37_08145 [Candidatus Binatia bacterium]